MYSDRSIHLFKSQRAVASRHISLHFQCITTARLVHPTDLEDYSCCATQVTFSNLLLLALLFRGFFIFPLTVVSDRRAEK